MDATYSYNAGILSMIHHFMMSVKLYSVRLSPRAPVQLLRLGFNFISSHSLPPSLPPDERSVFHLTHFAGR